MGGNDAYGSLHQEMQRWVWLQRWEELRPIQRNAIPEIIGADRDVVLSAPTAAGKTEAAYLPIFSNLLSHPVESGYSVLNISPLKALINDQSARLADMGAAAGISVTPWHGDVSASSKLGSLRNPEGVLLITPESLESLLANRAHALEPALQHLRYVVIDELHAFMGSERGVQLQSLLARIEHMIGRKVPRIALSATFADYTQAIDFLRPGRVDYPVSVPSPGPGGHDTMVLVKEIVPTVDAQYEEIVARDIYRNLRGTNNLVFANSRKEVEAMALRLRDLCDDNGVPNEFMLHHGSLSKHDRESVEKALKEGVHPATAICTSTLELGVDIGKVKSIAQLITANSVSALRQRLGRSGRRGEPSVLRIYSLDEAREDFKYFLRTNLVQNVAVIELLAQSQYEGINPEVPHYSTLVQQILSLIAQYGGFYAQEGWRLLCREGAFRNVSAADFLDLLRALGAKQVVTQTGAGQIVIGEAGEKIVKSLDFYTAFVTIKDFTVVDMATGKSIGVVQYLPYAGEYILLSGRRWLVDSIDERTGKVCVHPAQTTGKMMFEGYGQEIDSIITRKMREIYLSDKQYPYLDAATGAQQHIEEARRFFREMRLDERSEVEIGGKRLLFTWGGMKLNRTLALMHKVRTGSVPYHDAYAVADVPETYLQLLPGTDLQLLASSVSRKRKETDKYDHLLPDHLLDKKYAAQALTKNFEF